MPCEVVTHSSVMGTGLQRLRCESRAHERGMSPTERLRGRARSRFITKHRVRARLQETDKGRVSRLCCHCIEPCQLRNLNPAADRRRINPTSKLTPTRAGSNTRSILRMPAIGRDGCGVGCAALIGRSDRRGAGQAQFLHPTAQRAGIEPQLPCRSERPVDPPRGSFEGVENVPPFRVIQRGRRSDDRCRY